MHCQWSVFQRKQEEMCYLFGKLFQTIGMIIFPGTCFYTKLSVNANIDWKVSGIHKNPCWLYDVAEQNLPLSILTQWRAPSWKALASFPRADLLFPYRLNQQFAPETDVLLQNTNHRCVWGLHKHKHISKKDREMWKSWSVSAVFWNISCWKGPCFLLHHFIASLDILSTLYPQCEHYMIRWKAVYIKAGHLLEENLQSTSPVYSFNPLWSSKRRLCPLFWNFSLVPQSG